VATVTDHHDRTSAAQQPAPQHIRALERANEIRLARGQQKRRLATARDVITARVLAADLIADPPAELATIAVHELLLSCRGLGERLVSEVLVLAGICGTEQVGNGAVRRGALTPRQREVLVDVLRGADVALREVA
jgi:hypothetical protein